MAYGARWREKNREKLNARAKEAYRAKDPVARRAEARARQVQYAERNSAWLWEYLQDKRCTDCEESDPIVLEFDHLPEFEKEYGISWLVATGMGLRTIVAEIAKCEIVCANCHRRRTARRAGSRKWQRAHPDEPTREPEPLRPVRPGRRPRGRPAA